MTLRFWLNLCWMLTLGAGLRMLGKAVLDLDGYHQRYIECVLVACACFLLTICFILLTCFI